MNAPLMQMIAGQLRQPTTENIGPANDPVWKITIDGEETPEQAMARWLMEMADTTGSEAFDPDEWMRAQEELYPEQPEPGEIAPNFNQRYPGDANE